MRLIDADALMEKLGIGKDCSMCEQDDTPYCRWDHNAVDVCEAICNAPTIEPERKTGKWIDDTYCSECCWVNEVEPGFIGSVKCFNFCPKCGSCNKDECDADVNI